MIADVSAIQEVGRASRQAGYVDTGLVTIEANDEVLRDAWSVDALMTSITHADNHAIVAVADKRVVGFLSGRYRNPAEQGQVRLYRIYLHPAWWWQHIGFRMWQHYRAAIDSSVKRIDVGVLSVNLRAMHFYRRLGFQLFGSEDGISQLQMLLD